MMEIDSPHPQGIYSFGKSFLQPFRPVIKLVIIFIPCIRTQYFHLHDPAAQPIIARARRVIKPDSKIVAPDPSPEATIIKHYNSPLPIPLPIPADVIAAAPTLPRRKSCVHISCPPVDTV